MMCSVGGSPHLLSFALRKRDQTHELQGRSDRALQPGGYCFEKEESDPLSGANKPPGQAGCECWGSAWPEPELSPF